MRYMIHRLNVGALAVVLVSAFLQARAGEPPTTKTSSRTTIEIVGDWHFQLDDPNIGEKENWQAIRFDRSKWAKVDVPKAWDPEATGLWKRSKSGGPRRPRGNDERKPDPARQCLALPRFHTPVNALALEVFLPRHRSRLDIPQKPV